MRTILGFALPLLMALPLASGQEKKPEKKDAAKVVVVVPLGVPAGATTTVTIRGLKLDAATEVRFADGKASVKLVKKEKARVPDKQEPAKVGDSLVEAEITVPAGTPEPTLSFVIVTPDGETAAHALLVNGSVPVVAEKEPNNGFRQAQAVQVPQAIDGAIGQPQDVDVFRFEGQAGQKLVCEVFAARHGSALDSILSLHTAAGRTVATSDDIDGSTDSHIEVVLPVTGTYYLSVIDAHDQGGPAHVYRLLIAAGR